MFASQHRLGGTAGVVDVAFTDRRGGVSAAPFDSLNLGGPDGAENRRLVADALGVDHLVVMRQVHGVDVTVVESDPPAPPVCDALVTRAERVALCARAADCVPVALADPDVGVAGVAHAGRGGMADGVVASSVAAMRRLGADRITAWIGPHVCGGCYEVPAEMRGDVADRVPAAFACTTWGTPSLDLGAGVAAQLRAAGCEVVDASSCTRETAELFSYRRDGDAAGRHGAVVVLRGRDG
jgi:YfiH family protein